MIGRRQATAEVSFWRRLHRPGFLWRGCSPLTAAPLRHRVQAGSFGVRATVKAACSSPTLSGFSVPVGGVNSSIASKPTWMETLAATLAEPMIFRFRKGRLEWRRRKAETRMQNSSLRHHRGGKGVAHSPPRFTPQ